ncbi:olfactory receptor 52P1-like [Tiliqua scincoides]|uniref:olfactory receptor 52P1-like n=1 Tax=Tiliqua scincoides TaxID=71010 RepID=UPI0034626CB8
MDKKRREAPIGPGRAWDPAPCKAEALLCERFEFTARLLHAAACRKSGVAVAHRVKGSRVRAPDSSMQPPPSNLSQASPAAFLLLGIPGLESLHTWLALPFCSMYLFALLGNCTVLVVIKTEPSLHQPMYLFLGMLSLTDLLLSTSALPKMLAIFWLGAGHISFSSCLTQMFFIHMLTAMESGFFLAMAYDRYVAICHPLRHTVILTGTHIARIGAAVLARGMVFFFPHPFLVGQLPFCRTTVVAHSYCEFMAIVKLACADPVGTKAYSLAVASLIGAFDVLFIGLSYGLILRTACRLPSKEAGLKALRTCGSHICVILIFYTTAVFTFLTHRFSHGSIPHHVHILMANVYLLVPPTVNPVIYGVRTKQIRERVLRGLHRKAA